MADKRREFRLIRFNHARAAVEAQYFRRALESAKHYYQAPVFFYVRDGLNTAAGEVEIGNGVGRQDADGIEPLRRKIDEAVRIERCGGDKEDFLLFDELFYGFVDECLRFTHFVVPFLGTSTEEVG